MKRLKARLTDGRIVEAVPGWTILHFEDRHEVSLFPTAEGPAALIRIREGDAFAERIPAGAGGLAGFVREHLGLMLGTFVGEDHDAGTVMYRLAPLEPGPPAGVHRLSEQQLADVFRTHSEEFGQGD